MSYSGSVKGTTSGGVVQPVHSSDNSLEVLIDGPLTAFGEMVTAAPLAVAQGDFVYGINTQIGTTSTTGSGTVTAASSVLSCSTTAATNSSGTYTSRRYLKYRPGQGGMARFTGLFTTGAANSTQIVGIGNTTDGMFFGYNGTAFGLCHRRSGTDYWTAVADWNIDNCSGSGGAANPSGMQIDPLKGNVFQVRYQYLGFGCLFFYVENPATGRFILVHKINWPNNNTTTNFSNPSFSFICSATNTTNNTAIVVKTVSYALFLEGTRQFLGPKYGADATKASITALVPVLSIRNATTYNTVANRSQIRLRQISFSSAANTAGGGGIMTIQVLLNATLTGPSFSAVSGTTADSGVTITSGQSIASTDTTASAVSGGTLLWNACVNSNNGFISFDCTESNIFCGPADVLTFAIKSSASGTGGVAVNWSEDQ